MAAPILLFDVNETLLDLSALDPAFERALGAAHLRFDWFLTLQGLWMTATLTGHFQPFDKLAAAALTLTAEREGRRLSSEDRHAILDGIKRLPPFRDVAPALDRLRACGIRLAALTNGTVTGVATQLRNAGLADKFEYAFSVEQVKKYKPADAPYRFAVRKLRAKPGAVHMVAAHAWDIEGAAAAGLHTIFVRRPGKALNPSGVRPDIVVADLEELAAEIEQRRRPRR